MRDRPIAMPPAFSVTASFVGRRNYTAAEIKEAVAAGIECSQGWSYRADDRRADLNVRVFIEQDVASIGVRLAAAPLHERSYRLVERAGALKPPVAAALLALAGVGPGARVLDPCCGTGTIAIEAALGGMAAAGGDRDPAAIGAARANAAAAGVAVRFRVMDALALPLDAGSVDYVVSNLPWGRQVSVDGERAIFYRRSLSEMRRVLAPGGRIVVLTALPQLVRLPGLRCRRQLEINLSGQRPAAVVMSA